MKVITHIAAVSGILSFVASDPIQSSSLNDRAAAPIVSIRNGTIRGTHNSAYNQDYFLGIPYAQAPVGDLRFNLPKPLTPSTVWSGEFDASSYGDRCFGVDNKIDLPESEDCLSVNIFRPSGYENKKLPVFIWIYGGGYTMGASSDPLYNLTFQVDSSVKLGKPIIGVTFNYRLSAFGFLGGTAVNKAGVTNLGIRDQRLLLHWIQENIAAFGGDPTKVVIGGESAGGFSSGIHMLAYGGRDDKLFRGAIMDSASALYSGRYGDLVDLDNVYAGFVDFVGCSAAMDTLACLRQIPYEYIAPVITYIQKTYPVWRAVVDGDLIEEFSSVQLKRGRFVRVPIIVGSATDEGRLFIQDPTTGFYGVETEEQFDQAIALYAGPTVTNDTLAEIKKLYPLKNYPERYGLPYLSEFERLGAIATDAFYLAGQRLTARAWSERGVAAYSYRWDTLTPDHPWQMGVQHASDVLYWLGNVDGVKRQVEIANLQPVIRQKLYVQEAVLMSRMLLSFVNDLTPNNHGVAGIPMWPTYKKEDPENIVFEGNSTALAHLEPDSFRKRMINLFIHRAREFAH